MKYIILFLLSFNVYGVDTSKVYIEQIGNNSIIDIEQIGTQNNYIRIYEFGSNDITITQKANNNTQSNSTELSVSGNSNTISLEQKTASEFSSFGKGIVANITEDNNSLSIQQKNSGSHYATVTLSGGNKTVDIVQQGSGSHIADVTLSGQTTSLSLTQSGGTQQFYSINFNCATAGGCQAIQVQQGQ